MPVISGPLSSEGAITGNIVFVPPKSVAAALALSGAVAAPVRFRALIDPGAGVTCAARGFFLKMGLRTPTGTSLLHTGGTGGVPTSSHHFDVDVVYVPAGSSPPVVIASGVRVSELDLTGQPVDVIIGRDVLDRCLFVYDGAARTWTLGF